MALPRFDFRAAPVSETEDRIANERRYRAEVERAFRSGDAMVRVVERELAGATHWAGAWAGDGTAYRKGAIVRDGAWLMVAIRDTVERPAPDAPGGPSPDWDVMMGP